jgi:hypothetical protein
VVCRTLSHALQPSSSPAPHLNSPSLQAAGPRSLTLAATALLRASAGPRAPPSVVS